MDVKEEIKKAYASGMIPQGYKLMIISATQLKTFSGTRDSCNRKWFFEKGLPKETRLIEPPRKATGFGTIVHEIAERYLNADDTGRDRETGKAVVLYPNNWEQAKTSYTGEIPPPIDMGEQRLVKALVSKAITEGILVREPGRKIEEGFFKHVGNYAPEDKCAGCGKCEDWHPLEECDGYVQVQGRSVWIMGYIDIMTPTKVSDHKTTKNMKYAMSAKKIAKDPAMLTYALMLVEKSPATGSPITRVELEHLVYLKDIDKPRVRRTPTSVPVSDLVSFWNRVGMQAQEMVRVAYTQDVGKWKTIEGAINDDQSQACRAYGGCPFLTVCGGQETVEMYQTRMVRMKKRQQKAALLHQQGADAMAKKMSLKDMISKGKGKPKGKPAAKPAANPKPAKAPSKAPAKAASGSKTKTSKSAALAMLTKGRKAPPSKPKSKKPKSKKPTPKPNVPRHDDEGTLIVAPWAVEGCTACAVDGVNTGFASKGGPCRICNAKAAAAEECSSEWFDLETDDKGRMSWTPKEEYAHLFDAGETEELEVTASEGTDVEPEPESYNCDDYGYKTWDAWTVDHSAWVSRNPGVDCDWEWADPGGRPAPEVKKPKAKKKKAKPVAGGCTKHPSCKGKKCLVGESTDTHYSDENEDEGTQGFTLYIGCVPVKGECKLTNLSTVFAELQAALVYANPGVSSYWELDAFKRRDAMQAKSVEIAARLDDKAVYCPSHVSPDMGSLLDTITPHAKVVIVGSV